MAGEAETNLGKFKNEGHTAFVLGYTGESGKALIKDFNQLQLFKRVVLIGRREITLDPSFGPEFEQKVVDFENLEAHRDVFKGLDIGFSCMGTTRGKAGAQGFVRVDHDYVLNAASIAKEEVQTKTVPSLYTRTKGQVEEALKVMHFDRLSIYRPAVLMCNRQESRPGEAVARFLLKPISYIFPTAITTPVEVLSRAMINNMVAPSTQSVELYENKAIHQLSGISGVCKSQNNRVSEAETSKAK
ncbi:hypothetical protein BaRGS_00017262 [Batillaria attramentaria]|uniref:NAD(P)-binding domain-containing protein n=1 Tax=Batillaria attramentaria TaxID=370345 RepID=A0ABD0KWX9_9CAEN